MVDARPWIQGKRRKEELDWDTILPLAPILKNTEIPEDSIVGVIHNIGFWGKEENNNFVSFNLFGIVLFCSPGGAK